MEKRRAQEKVLEDAKSDINFGSQIRSYVLAPYRMVKDLARSLAIGDVDSVLDGAIDSLIHAWLVWKKTGQNRGRRQGRDAGVEVWPEPATRSRRPRRCPARRPACRLSHRDRLRPRANALDPAAVRRVYEAKGRPSGLAAHRARRICRTGARAGRGMARSRHGATGAVVLARPIDSGLPKTAAIPDEATGGLPTVGLRMPAHPMALALIRAAGVPVAAPSANRFTGLSPTRAEHVRLSLGDDVDLILDGGPTVVGIESTVLSLTGARPTSCAWGRSRARRSKRASVLWTWPVPL
jgi:hypothetical protein